MRARARARARPSAWWLALAVIAVAALAWRVGYTLAVYGDDSQLFDEGDAFVYGLVAQDSVDGRWFRYTIDGAHASLHPPLTVAALLPASAVFQDSVLAQLLTMSVVGALAVVVVGLLGRAVGGPAVGLVAAGIAAANANLWMNDALVMSESLAALLVAVVLLLGVRLWSLLWLWSEPSAPPWWLTVVTGVVCGVAILCRAEYGLFLPLLVVPALVLRHRQWARAAVACAVALAIVLPWSAWSSAEAGRFVLVSTNDTTTLVGANCDDAWYDGEIGTWSLFCVERLQRTGSASNGDAFEYVRANLGRLPLVVVAREGRTFGFWRPDQQVRSNVYEGRPRWASWGGYVTFWLLLPVAIYGAVLLRRRDGGSALLWPFAACAVVVVLVSAAFYGLPRFRLPLDVATCVLAAYAICAQVRRWRRSTASSITS